MKLTKQRLRDIIKEELSRALEEAGEYPGRPEDPHKKNIVDNFINKYTRLGFSPNRAEIEKLYDGGANSGTKLAVAKRYPIEREGF